MGKYIEVVNNGRNIAYDLYKQFRPDTDLNLDSIVHRNASIKCVDPDGRIYNVIGFNMKLQMDEVPYNIRSQTITVVTDIQKRADKRIIDDFVRFNIHKDKDDKYTMPDRDLHEYNLRYRTNYKKASSVVNSINKRVHGLYIMEMVERYEISDIDTNNPSITKSGLEAFNNDHGVICYSVKDVLHEIKKGFVPSKRDEGELIKIYPYCKLCISRNTNNKIVEVYNGNKYRSYKQAFNNWVRYDVNPFVEKYPNSDVVRAERTVEKTPKGFHITEITYTKQGIIQNIKESDVPKNGKSTEYTSTTYVPVAKDHKNGIIIPKTKTKVIHSIERGGVVVDYKETNYDKAGRITGEKTILLNEETMWQCCVDIVYSGNKIVSKTVKNPCDVDSYGYTYEAYDRKGRVIRSKVSDSHGNITDIKQAFALLTALDVYEACSSITSGAKIRIYDLDTDRYYDWKKLVKNPVTQDIVILLE